MQPLAGMDPSRLPAHAAASSHFALHVISVHVEVHVIAVST